MDQVYPDEGLIAALVAQVRGQTGGALFWDLFTAPLGPANLSLTLSGLALCSSAGQFAAIRVPLSSLTIQILSEHVGTIQGAPISFLNISGTPVLVQGYAIYDSAVRVLQGVAYLDDPTLVGTGKTLQITPILGTFSGLTS
jgi:hypothetical protein